MPVELHYDKEINILFGTLINPLTHEEFHSAIASIARSSEFPPNVRTLWDLRELDFEKFGFDFVERLVAIKELYPERGTARFAVVVRDKLGFGVSRMYQSLAADLPQDARVFMSYAEGKNWVLSGSP